ncbi:MAG: FAD-dependent oxidoreductase [Desulfobacteraceae bacterium]|nr:FAD-dependent oxidoreductase [Desulfobacteraceae bacterium]
MRRAGRRKSKVEFCKEQARLFPTVDDERIEDTMKTIMEPQKEVPVFEEADVIIVGGGPAGIGAALASARNGAKTILIEKFGALGGMQTHAMSSTFSLIDPAIQGGVITDVINRLRADGGILRDASPRTRQAAFSSTSFDCEVYKAMLDDMMAEAGVKLLYHTSGVGAIKENNALKGIFIECIQGRFVILGKVIVDSTGNADIAWKSGTACMDDGHGKGPKAGRHMGFGCRLYISGVDADKFAKFKKENPEEWAGLYGGKSIVRKAKAEGRYHGYREGLIIHTRKPGIAMIEGFNSPLAQGHHGWMIEDVTAGEIDLRKQVWSAFRLIKENVPGFEHASVEKTGTIPIFRDTHRILGEYILSEEDIYKGRAFDDSIAVSNMGPDIYGPDEEHVYEVVRPHDIPYGCLVSRETDNLLAAGSTISADFYAFAADRYCAPSMCTGQAAGTAAALAAKLNVTPRQLDVKLLQDALRTQGARVSVKDIPKDVLEEYETRFEKNRNIDDV